MKIVRDYKLRIEYDNDPGYHPLGICVIRHGDCEAEFYGKNLSTLLRNAAKKIAELEEAEH